MSFYLKLTLVPFKYINIAKFGYVQFNRITLEVNVDDKAILNSKLYYYCN